MAGYKINPRGGFLFVGSSNSYFGICGKACRVGLVLGPSDPDLDRSKD